MTIVPKHPEEVVSSRGYLVTFVTVFLSSSKEVEQEHR